MGKTDTHAHNYCFQKVIEKNQNRVSLKNSDRRHDETRYYTTDDVARVGGDDGVALDGEPARVGRHEEGREESKRGAGAHGDFVFWLWLS